MSKAGNTLMGILGAALIGLFSLSGCGQTGGNSNSAPATQPADQPDPGSEVVQETVEEMPGGGPEVLTELMITDVNTGDGDVAEAGKNIIVHYTGWLYDPTQPENKGSKFDSSVDRGQPFRFPLGAGRVIQGWDQGFDGMQIGGKRLLIIPPELGYGERGAGADIPPNSILLFEVDLLGIE